MAPTMHRGTSKNSLEYGWEMVKRNSDHKCFHFLKGGPQVPEEHVFYKEEQGHKQDTSQ